MIMRLNIILEGPEDVESHFKVSPMYRFKGLNANLACNNEMLAHTLSCLVKKAWDVGSFLIEDESVFSWSGACPVEVFIPRKPTPMACSLMANAPGYMLGVLSAPSIFLLVY